MHHAHFSLSRRGQEHTPYIYVGGKLVPPKDMLAATRAPGAGLKALLAAAGAPQPTGYFRP